MRWTPIFPHSPGTPAPEIERPLLAAAALLASARLRRLRHPIPAARADLSRARSDLADLARREARPC